MESSQGLEGISILFTIWKKMLSQLERDQMKAIVTFIMLKDQKNSQFDLATLLYPVVVAYPNYL
jgi:hypothetical protein